MTKEEYLKKLEKPLSVLNIFNEFFGESKVDLQGFPEYSSDLSSDTLGVEGRILVRFPSVTVTNEYDQSILINELFVKVRLSLEGRLIGTFTMNRAEYPEYQFKSGYLHSHIPGIPTSNFTAFQSPCLGTGPIRSTVSSLNMEYDENIWRLFCVELSKYVCTESISGGPYHRLERVGSEGDQKLELSTQNISCRSASSSIYNITIVKFIPELLKANVLKFRYLGGKYTLAMSERDVILTISNLFIEWYNKNLETQRDQWWKKAVLAAHGVITKVIDNGVDLFTTCTRYNEEDISQYNGSYICDFKGSAVYLKINKSESKTNSVTVLSSTYISNIIYLLLSILNYEYSTGKATDASSKRVYFI